MTITVREYNPADYDDCCNLWGELAQHHADIYDDPSLADNAPRKYFDEYLRRPDICGIWVAELDGTVVGFAGLLDIMGEEGVAEIEPIVISAGVRGRGIGSELIGLLNKKAIEKKFRILAIRPVLRNKEAFLLYVRLGFDHIGSIELFQDLSSKKEKKWLKGINVHGQELTY